MALPPSVILAEALRRTKSSVIPFCPQQPTDRQKEFYDLDGLDALFGGSAGGGKSSALLMAALKYMSVPGYAALIIRRTYSDLALPGAIMDRAKEWFIPQGIPWNETLKQFRFPTSGVPSTLTFGYMDTDKDRFRYQGSELQFVGVDEATQLPESWPMYLFSRLRRNGSINAPLRFRMTANPGGIGHEWVRRRYVEGDGIFVPSKLDDNPHVDATEYRRSLSHLDANTRRQLLDGIWVRDSGGLVYSYDAERNRIDRIPDGISHKILGVDFGIVDDCAFTLIGWRDNDPTVYVLFSYRKSRCGVTDAAIEVQQIMNRHSLERVIGDEGGMGKAFAHEARVRFKIPMEPADKTSKRGFIGLFNGALERGQIKIVKGACDDLEKEWLELPWDETRTSEVDGFSNHNCDSALYAWRAAPNFGASPLEDVPPPNTQAFVDWQGARWNAEQDEKWERARSAAERQRREDERMERWERE